MHLSFKQKYTCFFGNIDDFNKYSREIKQAIRKNAREINHSQEKIKNAKIRLYRKYVKKSDQTKSNFCLLQLITNELGKIVDFEEFAFFLQEEQDNLKKDLRDLNGIIFVQNLIEKLKKIEEV